MAEKIDKYWKIECSKGMKALYSNVIPVNHLKEPALKKLLFYLALKYALTDQEVTEQFLTIPFRKKTQYFDIQRRQSFKNEKIHISFSIEVSSVSVTATLINSTINLKK
jgi:hypothetical protein